MKCRCTDNFAHSNSEHFHNSGLDRRSKIRMRLNSTHKRDGVRLGRKFIKVNRHSVVSLSNLNDFHTRLNRAANISLRHTITVKNFFLSFSCCTAMAAHSWKNKRLGTQRLELRYDRFDTLSNVIHTARSNAECNGHTWLDS